MWKIAEDYNRNRAVLKGRLTEDEKQKTAIRTPADIESSSVIPIYTFMKALLKCNLDDKNAKNHSDRASLKLLKTQKR